MKILVTGTAGFIGYHLAKVANSGCEANFPRKKLLERGDEVVGTNVMFNDEFLMFNFAIRIVKLYKHLCDDKKEYVLSKQLLRSETRKAKVNCFTLVELEPEILCKA